MKMSEQEQLEFRIEELNEFYRIGESRVSDQAYDQLVEELKTKFPNSLLLAKGVIEQSKESRKQKLSIPMFSLNKLKTVEEIISWLKSNNISKNELLILTPKFDGISLVVNERNNQAWTRGDGEYGQKSTYHYLQTRRKLDGYHREGRDFYSFGEAIMSKKNFEKFKSEFANPRNMVAGLFNRDITTHSLQDVDYIRYGCDNITDKISQIELLNSINKVECKYLILRAEEFFKMDAEMIQESLNIVYQKWSEDYQIDGLVIDINSSELRQKLGREENMNPKYARAYKNPEWSGSAKVKVIGVTWQVSKQGKLKPVIQIEPTEVSGVTIENVTGYNAKYVIDNNIAEDSIIKIVRSGDVIPKHIETISHNDWSIEKMIDSVVICPSCEGQARWDQTMTELVCLNPQCRGKQIAKLVHFFKTVGIEEFGEPSIVRLYNENYSSIEGILDISEEELCNIEGFAKKSAKVLLKQFKTLLEVGIPFARTVDACDVMQGKLGEKTIQLIFDHLTNEEIDGLIDIKRGAELNHKLINIKGVSDITANIFIDGMIDFNLIWFVNLPIKTTYIQTPKKEVTGDKFKGQKLCFTGCRPSKEIEEEIQSQGGQIVSGVSSKTTILVVKDLSEKVLSSSKATKAKGLGIKIIEINKL